MQRLFYTIIILLGCTQLYACNKDKDITTPGEENIIKQDTMKLKITIGNKTATAVLYDNATGRDFAKRLPLTVEMEDYSNTEKIFYPNPALSTEGAPAGFDPSIGDLTVYVPWGNVALFYKDFGYSQGLVSFGKITSGMEAFTVNGSITVKIELVKE